MIAAFRDALAMQDVDATMALWAENGRLLGTVDEADTWPANDGVRVGTEAVRDYFVGFIGELSPYVSVEPFFPPEIEESDLQFFGDSFVSYSGYWTLDFVTAEGVEIEGFAKYTFVYEQTEEGLKIALLNSGLTPTGLVVAE